MRKALIVAVVVLATLAGAATALVTFRIDRGLDVGTVRLSVDPASNGALDLYVPVVDWGVRFPVVRLPARVSVDVRAVDRDAILKLASAGDLDTEFVRSQARDALAFYLRLAILVSVLAGLAFGVLVALAVRGGPGPPLRTTLATAAVTALAIGVALVVLLPPRSNVDSPEYYANGTEVPAALRTIEALGASAQTLDDEIDQQLVGIARLVTSPAGRAPVERLPRLTVASDLHNNVLALPALERAARGGPLFFVGDLTDRGSAVEQALVLRVVRAGSPMVFISGNHDSDVLERKLARAGAIVLTREGRLRGDGTADGALATNVRGLRVAGYDDPLKRLARENYRDNGATPTVQEQEQFTTWLRARVGKVDVVLVHAPALAQPALDALGEAQPAAPLLILEGHTHVAGIEHDGTLSIVNGGSVGGGGTGNLTELEGDIALARVTYARAPAFAPAAADLIEIDPGDGEARAERVRLDTPADASG
ncbi:MAG TPA: metallophosphoesterase family protein [Solirubrobacteraceae bacterium]|nr:metallophosphoesterase family protein [Solirubrobacteraceae bacterium]